MISILLAIVVAGFVCWLVTFLPLANPFKQIFMGVVVLFLVLWILQSFGLVGAHWRLRV